MSDYSLKNGKKVTIPIKGLDQFGNDIAVPAGLQATTSDSAIATVDIGSDGSSIVITSVAAGDVVISIVDGDVSASLSITIEPAVEAPKLATLTFDLANAVVEDIQVTPSPAPSAPSDAPVDPSAVDPAAPAGGPSSNGS